MPAAPATPQLPMPPESDSINALRSRLTLILFLVPRSGGISSGTRYGDFGGSGSAKTTISPVFALGHRALRAGGIDEQDRQQDQ
jgi:hypothetical protein